MFCKNCGKEIEDKAVFCPYCGVMTENNMKDGSNNYRENQNINYNSNGNYNRNGGTFDYDAPSAGFGVLGFFFPLIGLILYLIWKDQYPLRAKSVGKGALISVIVSVAVSVLYFIFVVVLLGAVSCGTTYYY